MIVAFAFLALAIYVRKPGRLPFKECAIYGYISWEAGPHLISRRGEEQMLCIAKRNRLSPKYQGTVLVFKNWVFIDSRFKQRKEIDHVSSRCLTVLLKESIVSDSPFISWKDLLLREQEL